MQLADFNQHAGFEALPDSPLTMGDLVGRSFRAFRLRMPFFFQVFFWPCIISSASMTGVKVCAALWLESPTHSFDLFMKLCGAILASFAVLLFAQWELSLRSLAVVRLLMQVDDTYAQCLAYARKRKWAVLTVYNAAVFLPIVAVAVWAGCIIATCLLWQHSGFVLRALSVLAVCGEAALMTVSFAWAILATSLLFSVLACENLPFKALQKRTMELTMRYLWRGGSFFCLLGLALILVAVSLDMPIFVMSIFEAAVHGQNAAHATYQAPLYLEIASAIWECVLNIVLLGVALLADGLYYNDLRLRSEGLDILTKLGQLKAQLT